MPMRKMMSIVFLLLVLIISLGVSGYMNSVNSLKEGLDEDPPTPEGEEPQETEGEESPATEGEESTFDVTPMEDACAETMTNYK